MSCVYPLQLLSSAILTLNLKKLLKSQTLLNDFNNFIISSSSIAFSTERVL